MATVKTYPLSGQFGGAARYGNLSTLRYLLETNASGVVLHSNAGEALAVDDVVSFEYPLPAGFLVEDVQVIVSAAFGDDVTANVGFAYADGVNDDDYPQDATAFGSALVLSAAGRIRTSSSKALFRLPKDAYLTVTLKGADAEAAGKAQIVVHGERMGEV